MSLKELLTKDPQKILQLLETLVHKQSPLVLSSKDCKALSVKALRIEALKNFNVLVVSNPGSFSCNKAEPCYIFYRPVEYLTHIMQTTPVSIGEDEISVIFPQVVYQMQRRRFPRVATPGQSVATFSQKGGTKLSTLR